MEARKRVSGGRLLETLRTLLIVGPMMLAGVAPFDEGAWASSPAGVKKGRALALSQERSRGEDGEGLDFSGEQASELRSIGTLKFDSPDSLPGSQADMDVESAEYKAFVAALDLMARGRYEVASLEFERFLRGGVFAAYGEESEYQLAKALFKLGLYHSSFEGFKAILKQGMEHRRFQKAVEWLFHLSRKMPDNHDVLRELSRFRDVKFPSEYADEHRYLVSRFLLTRSYEESVDAQQRRRFKASAPRETTSVLDFGESDLVEADEVLDFGADAPAEPPLAGEVLDFGASDLGVGSGGTSVKADSLLQWGRHLASRVGRESPFHVRAIYLRGLYDLYENRDQDAVHAFQEVVRKTNPRVVERPDSATRELGILSLGRMHYAHKQFDRSIYYYRQIHRDSSWWLTALLESSWAYLRRSDFDKALGNLLTLHSPFFERQYFPESMLIKSIIYYEACRYEEARKFSDKFLTQYRPLMEQVQAAVDSKDTSQWVKLLLGERDGDAVAMGGAFGDLVRRDPELRAARRRMQGFQEEEKLLADLMVGRFVGSEMGRGLGEMYRESRVQLLEEVLGMVRRRLRIEAETLRGLLAQGLRIQLEIARAEREVLQRSANGEVVGEVIPPANLEVKVDDEHLYWPYEGEFWRDELGTYEVAFSQCRESGALEKSQNN
ncbi:MAG: hypothetical protein VX699_13525 [Myxococcota bacterium]|nr:hypothetical protein [Myxococcota bacterium]